MVQRLSFDHGLTDCLPPLHLRRNAMCRKYDCTLIGTHSLCAQAAARLFR
jgi:hypothetical protein